MEEVPRKQLAGMKILVVEDEKGMTQVLRRGLEEDDHAVSLAHDSPSALSLAQDTQFDLVLARRDAAWNQRDSGRAPISRTPARHCGSIEGREYARQRLRLLYYSAHGYESLAPSCLRTCSADAIRPSSESEDSFIFISKIREQPFISQ